MNEQQNVLKLFCISLQTISNLIHSAKKMSKCQKLVSVRIILLHVNDTECSFQKTNANGLWG